MKIVKTIKDLENSLLSNEDKFVFEGPKASEIAHKIEEAQCKKRRARNTGLGLGLLCLVVAPFTCGTSLLGLGATGAIALSDGVIMAIIGAVTSISSVAINRAYNYKIARIDNDRIEFTHK